MGLGGPELVIVTLLALLVLSVPVAVIALVVALVGPRRSSPTSLAPRPPTREARLVAVTRLVGVVVGLVAAVVTAYSSRYGRGPLLAPAMFGLCVTLAVAVGETVVRPRRTGVRSASLRPRRVIAYLPPVMSGLVVTVLVLEAALMVLTSLTAGRDGSSGSMRALTCHVAVETFSSTPYPGSYYTVPLAVLLVVVLGVAAVAGRQVVLRPGGHAPDDVGDDALRRRSLDVIVASVGIAVTAAYVGLALTAQRAVQDLQSQHPACAAAGLSSWGSSLLPTALLAFVVGTWCVVRLLTGSAEQFVRADPVGVHR